MKALNRFLAAVFALGLAAICFLVVVETVVALIGREPALVPHDAWIASLESYRWSAPEVLWTSVAIMTGGLILIVVQMLPTRPPGLSTVFSRADAQVRVDRSALERSLARAATDVEGVKRAKSRARRKRVKTTVHVAGGDDGKRAEAVRKAIEQRLERFGANHLRAQSVKFRHRGRVR